MDDLISKTWKSDNFRYHKNVAGKIAVNDVFMICRFNVIYGQNPIVIKAKTAECINPEKRLHRAHQGADVWGAGYGFRITKLHIKWH